MVLHQQMVNETLHHFRKLGIDFQSDYSEIKILNNEILNNLNARQKTY